MDGAQQLWHTGRRKNKGGFTHVRRKDNSQPDFRGRTDLDSVDRLDNPEGSAARRSGDYFASALLRRDICRIGTHAENAQT